jgi:hypothetical protein
MFPQDWFATTNEGKFVGEIVRWGFLNYVFQTSCAENLIL